MKSARVRTPRSVYAANRRCVMRIAAHMNTTHNMTSEGIQTRHWNREGKATRLMS